MARLGKQDWIDEGLKVLTEVGYEGIKIDKLCKRLNISIGSFYHHFRNIDDYVEKMILKWEQMTHDNFVEIGEKGISAEKRYNMLQDAVFENPPKLEVAVRSWSFQNPFIERSVEKIDKKRVRIMTSLFTEMGYAPEVARRFAEIEYAAYLGVQTYCMNRSKHSAKKLYSAFDKIMRQYKNDMQLVV